MSSVDNPHSQPPDVARAWRAEIASATGGGEHVAHDPRDSLMNQVFAVGLDLHAALALTDDDDAAERIRCAINGLDRIIDGLRHAVFASRVAGQHTHVRDGAPTDARCP